MPEFESINSALLQRSTVESQTAQQLHLWRSAFASHPKAIATPPTLPTLIHFPSRPSGRVFACHEYPYSVSKGDRAVATAIVPINKTSISLRQQEGRVSLSVLMLSVLLLIYLRLFHWPRVLGSLSQLFSGKALMKLDSESTPQQRFYHLIVDFLSTVLIAYYFWILCQRYAITLSLIEFQKHPLLLYMSILLMMFILYAIQYLSIRIWGYLSKSKEDFIGIWRHAQLPIRMLWIPLLVVNIGLTYVLSVDANYRVLLGLIIIGLALLLRWLREALAFRRVAVKPFYFFLYFYGAELTPFLLVLRWLNLLPSSI